MKTVVVQDDRNFIDIYEVKDGDIVEKKVIGFGLRKAKAILASLPEIEQYVKDQEEARLNLKVKPNSTLEKAKALAASKS